MSSYRACKRRFSFVVHVGLLNFRGMRVGFLEKKRHYDEGGVIAVMISMRYWKRRGTTMK